MEALKCMNVSIDPRPLDARYRITFHRFRVHPSIYFANGDDCCLRAFQMIDVLL